MKIAHSFNEKENGQPFSLGVGSIILRIWALTSLQSPLSDFVAESTQTRPVVRRHLNFIVSPDDEVLQQQVGHIWTGNVLDLVVHWQPSQTVSRTRIYSIWTFISGCFHTVKPWENPCESWAFGCSTPDVLLGGNKASANTTRDCPDCRKTPAVSFGCNE